MIVSTMGDRTEHLLTSTGLGANVVTVEETGTYRSPDGSVSKRLIAGAQIDIAEARQLGIVTDKVGVPDAAAAGDPVVGEQIAQHLRAAGYAVTGFALSSPTDYVQATDAEVAAGVTGVTDGTEAPDVSDQPKWYQDYVSKARDAGDEVVEREGDETQRDHRERVDALAAEKAEQEAQNKAEGVDQNKSDG
jgi:hypothetical protein